jgi:hypothetical protein
MDVGGAAACQFDLDMANDTTGAEQYNCGMLNSNSQHWMDGALAGKSVGLKYSGGSDLGGCAPAKRSTTISVICDPCNMHNISFVSEPEKCQYHVNITSIAGCATNKPQPKGSCPHICDPNTMQCKSVPSGTPGANATLGQCTATCKKPPPPPPPPPPPTPLYSEPCIRVANTIPTAHNVDIKIDQPSSGRSYTWKNNAFGVFTNWTSHFLTGTGTISLIDSSSGATLLSIADAPLTPGPLVVVAKCPTGLEILRG